MSQSYKKNNHRNFKKKIISMAVASIFVPQVSHALEFVQEPPLPKASATYVPPNVIISLDNSRSMKYRLDSDHNGDDSSNQCKIPEEGGNWIAGWSAPNKCSRLLALKYSIDQVFRDKDVVGEGKIRLAWQAMHGTNNELVHKQDNSMQPIDKKFDSGETHRQKFLKFVKNLSVDGYTPSHRMFYQADSYMRDVLHSDGPWSTNPGGTDEKSREYLGCRRNYHIFMTDGQWNFADDEFKSKKTTTNNQIKDFGDEKTREAGDGKKTYNTSSNQSNIYTDDYSNTLADWAFHSWMDPLQKPEYLLDADQIKPSKEYQEAPEKEIFSKVGEIYLDYKKEDDCKKNGGTWQNKKCTKETIFSVNLEKYWNPKYNPATWPHMVTYTIGFSNDAISWDNNLQIEAPSIIKNQSQTEGYFGWDKGFISLVTGEKKWPDLETDNSSYGAASNKRALDLWHAAINGRGRFYPVKTGDGLKEAFRSIIEKINEENAVLPSELHAGGAASGYSVAENNAGIFASGYSPKDGWTGWVKAASAVEPQEVPCGVYADEVGNPKEQEEGESPSAGGGAGAETCWRFPSVVGGWEEKTTAQRLDGLIDGYVKDSRLILGWNDATSTGASFKWSDDTETYMSTAQKALLGMTSSADGATTKNKGLNILNYVRGSNEFANSEVGAIKEDKPLRKRMSRQGDIVNSEIWYTGGAVSNFGLGGYTAFRNSVAKRTPMLYVGGNDGMLHGFSAEDGTEKIAYVPRGVMGKLKNLADPGYINDHKYYVDGSPMTGDIKTGNGNTASDWKTVLVGTLGLGGRGYFVLDVTNPANFSEAQAAATVLLDKTFGDKEDTSGVDADIGAITAAPVRNPSNMQQTSQIARLNNGRWAVVMGNGYNSKNQRPALLVQYLDGNDKQLKVIPATSDAAGSGNAKDNGLSAPALVDLDGNGTPDIVYAGDNLGNLWKFDLLSSDDTKWGVAFDNNPLFTAKGPKTTGGNRTEVQPITTAPIVRANNRNMTVDLGGGETRTQSIGGLVVAFGTGRNLTYDDRDMNKPKNVQTLYSITDRTSYTRESGQLKVHLGDAGCTENSPALCVLPPSPIGTLGADASVANNKKLAERKFVKLNDDYRTLEVEDALNQGTWKNYSGWYVDFLDTGERLLKPMQFYSGTNILAVYSETPDGTSGEEGSGEVTESCTPEAISTVNGKMVRSFINIMDGTAPAFPIMYYNGSLEYDLKIVGKKVPKGSPLLMGSLDGGLDKTGGGNEALAPIPEQSMRPNWRQLQ